MPYKRILIPTDGSPLSSAAARAGIEFAKDLHSEIIGVYVGPEYNLLMYGEGGTVPSNFMPEGEYKDRVKAGGESYFKEMREAANTAGLKFTSYTGFAESPAACIVDVAKQNDCDLIFMGSHGRGALGRFLLGSVTSKVLSTCSIPVLVYREKN